MHRTPTPHDRRPSPTRPLRAAALLALLLLVPLLTACPDPTDLVPPGQPPSGDTALPVPTDLAAIPGDGRITLSWRSNAPEHELYLAPAAGADARAERTLTATTSPHTISGLSNGTTYRIAIRARDGDRASARSAAVTATPNAGAPADPDADLTLPGGEHVFSDVRIRDGVTVTFADDAVVIVTGDAEVDGAIRSDCHALEIRVAGALRLDGVVDNSCSDADAEPEDLKLVIDGELRIGTVPSPDPALVSDGFLTLVDSATEHDTLEPVARFGDVETMLAAAGDATPGPVPLAGGAPGAVKRPIRAKRGANIRRFGDLDVGPLGAQTADRGADAPTRDEANCDLSLYVGGGGGSIHLGSRTGTLTITGDLKGGDGGTGGTCLDTKGAGRDASATGGPGGRGGSVLVGGTIIRFVGAVTLTMGDGGAGGAAFAKAPDGAAPCEAGYAATAIGGEGGGPGGLGYLYNVPGGIVGAPQEAGGNGGAGGQADAEGGSAQDCPTGDGADGGSASATGGEGGNGVRASAWPVKDGHRSGDGGAATAVAGDGGAGANDCFLFFVGGHGGQGGSATATGGEAGRFGLKGRGQRGRATAQGGAGGDGGDGLPPGDGGPFGPATADGRVPTEADGDPGADGEPCPLPLGFFLAAPDLPEGPVEPGQYYLAVLDLEGTPRGDTVEVEVRSDGADYAVRDERFVVGPNGGLEFVFDDVDGEVTAFRATLAAGCEAGAVRLRGLIDGEVVVDLPAEVGPDGTRLEIALDAPDGTPGFDAVYLESEGAELCLASGAIELAIEEPAPPPSDLRYFDLFRVDPGEIEPGTEIALGVVGSDLESPTGHVVPTVFQDALDAAYYAGDGMLAIVQGGLEFDLREVGGPVVRFEVRLDPALCETEPGTPVTLRAFRDGEPVASAEVTLEDATAILGVEDAFGFDEVYLETPDGWFCLHHGGIRFATGG